MNFIKNKKKIHDKSFFFVWMACLIFSLFFIGYFFFLRTIEIDVTKHIVLRYSGENGSATLRVSNEEVSINQRLQDFYDSLRFTVTPNENLSNGDQVTISAEYDHELAQQYHLEPIHQVTTITVEGLPDRYTDASAIPQSMLDTLPELAENYLNKHLLAILNNDFTDFYQAQEVTLDSSSIIYEAFMKSKNTENSDRLIVVYQLEAHGKMNRSDSEEKLQELSSTIYYMVVFPSINDTGEIVEANAYGEKLLVTLDDDEEKRIEQLEEYLLKKGKNSYTIEQVNKADETEESAA